MLIIIYILAGALIATMILSKIVRDSEGKDSTAFYNCAVMCGAELVFLGTALGMQGMVDSTFLIGLIFVPIGLLFVWAFGGDH